MTRTALGLTSILVAGLLFTGFAAPRPAHAGDLGRIIAGIAAGAIVYELLDNDDHHPRYEYSSRGFYDGNTRSWDYGPSYRGGSSSYCPPSYHRPSSQSSYNRGYNRGYNQGYDRGWNNGYNWGYDRGYDRGYDNGYRDGWNDRGDYDRWRWGGCF